MTGPALARAILTLAAAWLLAAPALAQPVSLGFNCLVAEGPRLTACEPLTTELAPDKVAALRLRVEATPACQLGDLEAGDSAQWVASFPDLRRLTRSTAIAEPYESNPDWLRRPDPEALTPYYPERAQREMVEGEATVACEVRTDGVLRDCEVMSEEPAGYGFGEATARAAEARFRMRPWMRGCDAVEGGTVRIPLRWVLPAQDEDLDEPPNPDAAPPRKLPRLSMPKLSRDMTIEGAALALGLALTLAGLRAIGRRPGAARATQGHPLIVEVPSRRPPAWLLAPIGLAVAAWAASQLWPRLPALRDLPAPGFRLPGEFSEYDLNLGFLSAMAVIYAAGIGSVNMVRRRLKALRRGQRVDVPHWALEDGRIRFWPAVTWIWTAEGPDFLGDPLLKALVGIARVGVLAAGLAVILLVLSIVL